MRTTMNELLNAQARQHEVSVKDWERGKASKELYRFFDLINARFVAGMR